MKQPNQLPLVAALAVSGVFLVVAGCNRINPQADVEAKFASDVITWMKLHDVELAHLPVTNMAQLFQFVKHKYPYVKHQELSRFGKRSGFTNSLAEKYAFFWPRFTHKYIEGEAVCMSAQPFPWRSEGLSRIYIARSGSNYIYRKLSENRMQVVLQEAKPTVVQLPKIEPPPPPPAEVQEWLNPPLRQRYDRFVRDLSGALGQDSHDFVRIALPIGAVSLVALLTFVCIVWLRRRRR